MPRFDRQPESWVRKFRHAGRGAAHAFRTQRSFWVHLPVAVAVIIGGMLHGVSQIEWAILILCIAIVLSAELFNTALEYLSQAITDDEDEHIRNALDVASGAVLVASIGALVVGCLVLVTKLAVALGIW
jgi:diacylglycerol kinase